MRLIQSVLDAIGVTLPDVGTPPHIAQRMINETVGSFYRFARAAEQNKMRFDEMFRGLKPSEVNDEALSNWAREVASISSRVELGPQEAAALEGLQEKVTGGLPTKSGKSNIVEMVDANGNKAEVEVDASGKPIRVVREL